MRKSRFVYMILTLAIVCLSSNLLTGYQKMSNSTTLNPSIIESVISIRSQEYRESLSTIDSDGPVIQAILGHIILDYCDSLPPSYTFKATVTDASGVDTVLVNISGVVHNMVHQPSDDDPDQYVYIHSIPNVNYYTMYYSYWANDTLGFTTETGSGYCDMAVWGICPSEATTTTSTSTGTNDNGTELLIEVSGVSIIAVLLLTLLFRVKSRT